MPRPEGALREGGLDLDENMIRAHARQLGATIGIAETDLEGRFTSVNETLCAILGRPAHALLARRCDDFARPDDRADRASVVNRLVRDGQPEMERVLEVKRPDGGHVWVRALLQVVFGPDHRPSHVFAQVQDITDQRRSLAALGDRLLRDGLTNLANRDLLADRLETELARSGRNGETVAAVAIDVDHFGRVNDSLGHDAGDEALIQIARRLEALAAPGDTVARSTGDEFVVISGAIDREVGAFLVADRLAHAFDEPFTAGGTEIFLNASIGVAMANPETTGTNLLRDAEAAVSQAKQRGGSRIEFFVELDRSEARDRLALASDLHRAVERQEFRVVYQPVMDLATSTVVGFEALVRWDHPERGVVSPGEFVPLAEEIGLIGVIGEWVLCQALDQITTWRRTLGQPDLWVAVNLSARQLLDRGCVEAVRAALMAGQVDPSALRLEITETALMADVSSSIAILRELKSLGIHLSIDDFGTGYSSLSYLRRLPIDTLKIDRSFVDGLGTDPLDTSIVEAIVTLGQSLHLELLAEGVETAAHLAEVRRLGCELAQGFLWTPPLPPDELVQWLSA